MFQSFENFKKTPGFNTTSYAVGHAAEIALLGTLREFFCDPELALNPEGHSFDYESPTRLVELKTRTVRRLQYFDTAIGLNKIRHARCSSKEVVFVFRFTNGLFYWKFDRAVALREGPLLGVQHCFIDTKLLVRIEDGLCAPSV